MCGLNTRIQVKNLEHAREEDVFNTSSITSLYRRGEITKMILRSWHAPTKLSPRLVCYCRKYSSTTKREGEGELEAGGDAGGQVMRMCDAKGGERNLAGQGCSRSPGLCLLKGPGFRLISSVASMYIESLLCRGSCTKYPTHMISFNPHTSL